MWFALDVKYAVGSCTARGLPSYGLPKTGIPPLTRDSSETCDFRTLPQILSPVAGTLPKNSYFTSDPISLLLRPRVEGRAEEWPPAPPGPGAVDARGTERLCPGALKATRDFKGIRRSHSSSAVVKPTQAGSLHCIRSTFELCVGVATY